MALSAFAGTISCPASTGNQATTGLGFQPKAIYFFGGRKTADGDTADFSTMQQGSGIGVSSSSRAAIGINNESSWGGRHDNTKCILVLAADNSVAVAADFVSHDSDGFTVNWTTVSSGVKVNYLALGGTDLTNVFLKEFTAPAATGNQAQTGVGFQPDAMILISIGHTTAPASTNGSRNELGIGFTDGTNQGCITANWNGAQGQDYQRTNACIATVNDTTKVIEAAIVSLDSDGFTLNFTTTTSGAYIWALCLKGGQYKVGSFNKPTATGNSGVTGVGFQPSAEMFLSFQRAAATTVGGSGDLFQGVASASGVEAASGLEHYTFGATTQAATKTFRALTGTGTITGSADFTSHDSDGFTLNWDTASATAYQILYLAIGNAAAASTIKPRSLMMTGMGQ